MDEFAVLGNLGGGTFAVTFKVQVLLPELVERYGASEVAIKVPRTQTDRELLRTELERLGFLHDTLSKLSRPGRENIVRFLGQGNFRNANFKIEPVHEIVAVFELMPGNLRHVMNARVPMEPRRALKISAGILQGLCLLHHVEMLHRDIKPENILMEGDVPKLTDFGLSRLLTANDLAYSVMGTPEYQSPELSQGQGTRLSADIWAVGVTMYEMFAGRRPFGTRNDPHFQEYTQRGKFDPLHEIQPNLPRSLSDLISRALSLDPKARPSAEQMLRAVRRIAQDPDDICRREIVRIRAEMQTTLVNLSALEKQVRDLVGRFPTDPKTYLMLAEFLNLCHRPDEALVALMRGLEKDADNSALLFAIAMDDWVRGRHSEALEYLTRAEEAGLEASNRPAAMALRIACSATLSTRA